MILPAQVEGYDPAVSPETPVEDFNSHTYEDILATAILNKVLESCEGERPNEVTIEVSHEVTSTDTDSGMSGGVKESRRRRGRKSEVSEAGSECSEERSLTSQRSRTPPVSPDQGVVTDDFWAQAASGEGPPLQFKIEEHVEEITTHHLTDDDEQDFEYFDEEDVSDSGGSWRGSKCSLDDSRGRPRRREKVSHHTAVAEDGLLSTLNIPLPDPSFAAARRVSFPELGADIIQDSCSDTECCPVGPGDMVLEAETWEHNWLFRRQKLVGGGTPDAVTMLIPNPESHVPATVGNRDVDELSELSEQQSLGSGEPWSTSDSDGEFDGRGETYHTYTASRELSTLAGEIVAEFAQQDQEYTVDYSVPSRVTASRSPELNTVRSKPPIALQLRHQGQTVSHNQIAKGYSNNKGVDGIKNPSAGERALLDDDLRYDLERPPVPKPRKLSLANSPTSKTSVKSPVLLLPSPSEDLSILSPPLDVPHPRNACSKSDTVWFVGVPEDCSVTQGRTLRLVCQVNTKRPMGLSWYLNGSLVSVNGRDLWAWRKGSYHHLHVYTMTPSKAGVYAAAAYTASDCVWTFCQIQHKASSRPQKRPAFSKGLSDVTLEEGAELHLQCQVTGHPEPRVVFSRGSEKLVPSPRVSIESDQYGTWSLRVSECTPADSGEISVTATNPVAAISTQCQVRVVPEGMLIPINQDPAESGYSNSSVTKQRDPYSTSGNRHKSRKSGKHDSKLHSNGSSPPHNSNPSWSSQNHIPLLTTANTDHSFSTPSGSVNIDTNDINGDIQQVPTKPGTHQKEVIVGLTYQPEVESQHVYFCDAATVKGNKFLNLIESDSLGANVHLNPAVHGYNEPMKPLDFSAVSDDGEDSSLGGGDGARCNEIPLNTVASINPEYRAGEVDNSSVFLISGEPCGLSLKGLPSSSYSSGATLDLDYCPSSHDDDSSLPSEDEERRSIKEPFSANHLPALNSHDLPLTSGQQHASSDPPRFNSLQEHEEYPLQGDETPDSPLLMSPPQPGTIAEREHRKWEAAVPLANNPYAPERLVHRLSHSRGATQTALPSHGIKIDFSKDGERVLDPSLRDGVPTKTDLNRYSRDYYIYSNSTSRNLHMQVMKSHPQLHQQHELPPHQRNTSKSLTNGIHEQPQGPLALPRNQVHIQIVGRGTQGSNNIGGDSITVPNQQEKATEVETSRPSDWKDELKDIQAARVEREVARFQRTIDETQRRWEANYARHASRGPSNIQSDSSAEVLHNPRHSAYLVPPRHDLWRTVSVDTINSPPKEKVLLEPLQRHTSVDNLRLTKVSNLRNLGSADHHHMNSMNTVSSISSINLNSMNKMSSYQHKPQHRQSVESMSGYSDGESHGDGNESDVSTRTQDETPILPSVKKLASKFNLASQERVNDLDKHETDGTLTFYGKKNIFLVDKSPSAEQPYSRNFTNNLNKRTEKPYTIKEVHSLTARSVPRQFREGLRDPPRIVTQNVLVKSQSNSSSSYTPRRDAPSPEHLGIPWGPAAIPLRPTQVPGDTSDDSSAPSGSPRRVPRRRSGGRRDHPGWHTRPECGALTDPTMQTAADSVC